MWKKFSNILLRNKLTFSLIIFLLTLFMGFEAYKMELSYQFVKILPDTDTTFIEYQNFKSQYTARLYQSFRARSNLVRVQKYC